LQEQTIIRAARLPCYGDIDIKGHARLQREKRRFQVIPNWPRKFPAILESIKYLAIAIDHIRRPGFRKRTALIAAATASITSAAAISAPAAVASAAAVPAAVGRIAGAVG
jgi:hypothetical protein